MAFSSDLGDLGPAQAISSGLQGLLEAYKMKLSAAQEDAKLRQSGFNAGDFRAQQINPVALASLFQRVKNQDLIDQDRDEARRLAAMLTPGESALLGLPYGTTRDEAAKKGVMAASQSTRLAMQKTKEVNAVLDNLSSQFNALDLPDDSTKAALHAPYAFAKSKLPGTKERLFVQTSGNISKILQGMGESKVLSDADMERVKPASLGSFYETKSSGRFKIDTFRDLAEEGHYNMRAGLTGSAIDVAPPPRLTDYLNRKKAAGVSQEYATTRARELLETGRLVQ